MAGHHSAHPPEDSLRALTLGKLNHETAAALLNHLDSCPDCSRQVATLSGEDFLVRLRQTQGQGSTPALRSLPRESWQSETAPPPELVNNPQYEIVRELGRGGMGVVYLARNKLMDRLEVLKVVNKALLDHPAAVERFLREIRSAAKLNHPNVVAAHSAVQYSELLAFAMEYVEGQDLASLVKSQGPLSIPHACYHVHQAALGLQHAFEKQMIHRDIKPQNLILAREGKKHIVKVLDFGLAKVMREKSEDTGLTGEGKMLGTPDYVAPEQTMDAAKADIRADIYSLGCTLYFLLSGHPPFSGSSLGAILVAHQMHDARPLNLVRPEVPEELAIVVRKMMAKSPAKRYQTPREVAQILTPFIKPGTTARPAPELSSGAAKPIAKKAVRVEMPPPPAAEALKPQPASVQGTLTESGGIAVAPSPSGVAHQPQATPGRRRTWRKRRMGCAIGASMILLMLLGMWRGGIFKAKTPEESNEHSDTERADFLTGTLPQLMGIFDFKDSFKKKTADLPKAITNSIGMKFVLVKPGTFLMGSPASEAGRSSDEEQHEVEITRSFYMGVYEVTQEQYERVIGSNPSSYSHKGANEDKVQGMDTPQFPVEMVAWHEAVEYCRKLSERPEEKTAGRRYRLPTEAEWEYSCRGGPLFKKPSPPFHLGNSLDSTLANFNGNNPYGGAAKGSRLQRTSKVGSYPANALGLYDLHGNVSEWCADWYDKGYYKRSPRQNPQGAETGERRVLRGGNYNYSGNVCRTAYRDEEVPGKRYSNYGFRVVSVVAAKN